MLPNIFRVPQGILTAQGGPLGRFLSGNVCSPVPDLILEAGSFVCPDGGARGDGAPARRRARPTPPNKMTTQR